MSEHDQPGVFTDLTDEAALAAMRRYVSWPLFRAAEFSELILDDNPYRRPLRPEDFDWLRFDEPLTTDTACRLSSLLGNRMLLGILEARSTILADDMTQRWQEHDEFYHPAVVALGERLRPALMDFLFGYAQATAAADDEQVVTDGAAAVHETVREIAAACHTRAADLRTFASQASHQDRIGRTVAIQLLALQLADPADSLAQWIVTPASLGSTDDRRLADAAAARLRHICDSAIHRADHYGLSQHRHDYFQFYLPTTIALMNYLLAARADPTRTVRTMGARMAAVLHIESMTGELPAGPPQPDVAHTAGLLCDLVVTPIGQRYGERGLRELSSGAKEFASLLSAHQFDLMQQVRWIEDDALYAAKASRLQQAISDNDLQVDLDTFVETCKECSTAHVHDDTRLVVIDSGEMHFWNANGEVHLFRPGDAMYVPAHRLHGSVVTSGTCVYHQPVITPEIEATYG